MEQNDMAERNYMPTSTASKGALDKLLSILAPMPRSYMEQGAPDWLDQPACLAEFSDAAVTAVAAELNDQWKDIIIRARPSQDEIMSMLATAQTIQRALDRLTQKQKQKHKHKHKHKHKQPS